jgi:hypothetical protein
MPSPDAQSGRPHAAAEAHTPHTVGVDRGIIERWRGRRAQRRLAGLLSPRNRRALAERLRRTANDATGRHPVLRGLDVPVNDRADAVRTQLVGIADLFERAHDPDPACVQEIRELLADRGSPLYHPAIHISELYAALYYIRAGLITQASGRLPADIPEREPTEATPSHNLQGERQAEATEGGHSDKTTPAVRAEHAGFLADPHTTSAKRQLGVVQCRRERRAERKHARLVSAGNRRRLARWLRLTANHATDRDPIRRRRDPLLHYRAAAVRTDLLEIAALLEHAHDPDPDCLAELRDLLANGCDSPLYNADIPFSQLQATLDYVRCGL